MSLTPVPQNVLKSWRLAQQMRQPWEPRWQRLAELAQPFSTPFYGRLRTPNTPLQTIYDETGLNALEEFANRLQTGLMPEGVEWAHYDYQGATDTQKQQLAGAQRYLFDLIAVSNFSTEANDWFKDIGGPGNGCMRVLPGDWRSPLQFQSIPLPNVYVTPGLHGTWGDIHVLYPVSSYVAVNQWPDAHWPDDLKNASCEQDLHIVDSWIRDLSSPTERWLNVLHWDGKALLRQREASGFGSCEYVFARWSKGSGELYGKGQGMHALPAMEVANEMVRYSFRAAEMQLSGIWQAEDDGVLNPWAVKLIPGTIVPIAPGSKGLQPLAMPGGRMELAQLTLDGQRQAIRKALYSEALGPREGTPPTALEIQQRLAELARAIGPAVARVWSEASVPLLQRCRYILDRKGLAQLPLIDGRKCKAVPMSALARAQKASVVQVVQQWGQGVAGLFGPAALAQEVNPSRVARFTAEQLGVPADLLNSDDEKASQAKAMGQLAAQNPEAAGMVLKAVSQGAKPGAANA